MSLPLFHTLKSAVLLVLVVWLLWGRTSAVDRTLLIGCAVLLGVRIGANRIYLGYHWTTDVATSWLVTLGRSRSWPWSPDHWSGPLQVELDPTHRRPASPNRRPSDSRALACAGRRRSADSSRCDNTPAADHTSRCTPMPPWQRPDVSVRKDPCELGKGSPPRGRC